MGVLALLHDRSDGALDIAHVIHGVEHTEYIHPVFGSAFNKSVDHIIGIVTVAKQVLTAQQHLLRGLGHGVFQFTNTLPGIFPQITNTGVKGGPAPGLQGPETDFVQRCSNGQHVVQAHASGKQGLVGVAQHHIGDAKWLSITHGGFPDYDWDCRC